MQITVIRHGQTRINLERKIQGSKTNEKLNFTGRQQIKETAKRLLIQGDTFDIIAASPLSRALESAVIINGVLMISDFILLEPLFQERDYGHFEQMNLDDFYLLRETKEINDYYENDQLFLQRIAGAINDLYRHYPEQKILLATHSQVIKALLIMAQVPNASFKIFIDNGDVLTFNVNQNNISYIGNNH